METPVVPNKKLFIVSVIVLVALFIISILIVVLSNQSKKQNQVNDTVQPTVDKSLEKQNTDLSPTQTINPPEQSKVYKNLYFSLKYPADWKEVENWPDGSYLVLQPLVLQPGETGRASVQINDANRVSVASMSAGLSILGFKKEAELVDGIQAQKFSGAINFPGKIVHNSAYLFEFKRKIYFIKLSYTQADVDTKLEREFSQIVKTFTVR